MTVFRRARMAYMPASVHTLRMSAPVELGHSLQQHPARTQVQCNRPRNPEHMLAKGLLHTFLHAYLSLSIAVEGLVHPLEMKAMLSGQTWNGERVIVATGPRATPDSQHLTVGVKLRIQVQVKA